MQKNLNITNGIFFSKSFVRINKCRFSREQAYKIVQKNAMNAWKENSSFLNKIISDKKITR